MTKILFNSFKKKNSDVLQPGQRLYKPRTDTDIGQSIVRDVQIEPKLVL